jgi:hypothetical protein
LLSRDEKDGGKDGHPFPVRRTTYEESIVFLQACRDKARIADRVSKSHNIQGCRILNLII